MIRNYNPDEDIDFDNVILFFSNKDCAPCHMLEDILNTIENIKVIKIDISEYLELAKSYDVTSIPTLKLFRKTINVFDIKGVRSAKDIVNILIHFDMI